MNKLRAYFCVICALIQSWSDISPSIFRHSHQANSVFGGTKFRAAGSKFRAAGSKFQAADSINMYQLKILARPPGWRCPRCLP